MRMSAKRFRQGGSSFSRPKMVGNHYANFSASPCRAGRFRLRTHPPNFINGLRKRRGGPADCENVFRADPVSLGVSQSPAIPLGQPSLNLHGMRGLVAAKGAGEIVFNFLLRVAAILIAELNADAGGSLALRALWRHPNHAPGDRQLFFLAPA